MVRMNYRLSNLRMLTLSLEGRFKNWKDLEFVSSESRVGKLEKDGGELNRTILQRDKKVPLKW